MILHYKANGKKQICPPRSLMNIDETPLTTGEANVPNGDSTATAAGSIHSMTNSGSVAGSVAA
jgi:WD repeat-containing protein 48